MTTWWWIAANGSSCAACPFPLPDKNLRVAPVPEHLVGFPTSDEQLAAQQFIQSASSTGVVDFLKSLEPLIDAGVVAYIQPENPEPPTQKEILWRATENDSRRDRMRI